MVRYLTYCEEARLKKIVLTDKGLEIQQAVVEILEESDDSLRSVYSEQELEQLLYLLDKLSNTLGE